ncbi:MAG: hypothetical protein ACRDQH_04045 [Pseudonocardiaceae bacterium]
MTQIEMVQASAEQARTLTDRIKVALGGTWLLIQEAYTSRAWAALGYASWDDYCTREFGTSRLRLPREERPEVVASMRDIGMSVRAIASATNTARNTVREALRAGPQVGHFDPPAVSGDDVQAGRWDGALREDGGERDDAATTGRQFANVTDKEHEADFGPIPEPPTPRPVTGTDGKTYSNKPKSPQRPRTDVVATVSRAIQRAQEAASAADEVTRQHLSGRKDEAAAWSRSLVKSLESLHGLRNRLEETQ